MESWEGQGHACLCPHVGRENWGTGRQSACWVKLWLLWDNGGNLNEAMKDSPLLCPGA